MTYNWQTKRSGRRVVAVIVLLIDIWVAVMIWRFAGLGWALAWLGWTRLTANVNAVAAKLDDLIEYHRYREAVQHFHE